MKKQFVVIALIMALVVFSGIVYAQLKSVENCTSDNDCVDAIKGKYCYTKTGECTAMKEPSVKGVCTKGIEGKYCDTKTEECTPITINTKEFGYGYNLINCDWGEPTEEERKLFEESGLTKGVFVEYKGKEYVIDPENAELPKEIEEDWRKEIEEQKKSIGYELSVKAGAIIIWIIIILAIILNRRKKIKR